MYRMRAGRVSLFALVFLVGGLIIGLIIGQFGAVSADPALQPTPEPTATAGRRIAPGTPTPPPTIPPIGTPPADGGTIDDQPVGGVPEIDPPATLDELIAQFPDLQPYIDSIADLTFDEMDLADLYARMVQIFEAEGATGLATFLKESGIQEKLGLPIAYLDLLTEYDNGGIEAVYTEAERRRYINTQNELVGYLTIDTPENVPSVIAELESLGISTYRFSDFTDELEIGIPLDVMAQYQTPGALLEYLAQIANLEHVEGLRGAERIVREQEPSGNPLDENSTYGVQRTGLEPWHAAGFTGRGVKIAVIDSGFIGAADAVDAGMLPADTQSNKDFDDLEYGSAHGTAVAVVVHRAAPEAEIHLVDYDLSSVSDFENVLEYIRENDFDIVNMSLGQWVGPRDGTDPWTVQIDEFVRETGVLWVNSAGNTADKRSMFRFNGGEGDLHDFGDGLQLLPFVARKDYTLVFMQWDGKWEGREDNEYNVIVYDRNGDEVAAGAEPIRGKRKDVPLQIAEFESVPGEIYFIAVQHVSGDTDKTIDIGIESGYPADWARVSESSIMVPADGFSVLSVGATALQTDDLERYSAQGPTFDGRLKPEISAPTGEGVPSYPLTGILERPGGFNGTSGAAPLVAGAAAVVLSAFPDLSNAELKAFMTQHVVDLGEAGADNLFGDGRMLLPDPATLDVSAPVDDPDDEGDSSERTEAAAPSAEITNVDLEFDVRVRRLTGMQISMSFDLDNFQGREVYAAAILLDMEGEPIESSNENYQWGRSIGTGVALDVDESETSFEDVTLFIPYNALDNLPSDAEEIVLMVGVVDYTDNEEGEILTYEEYTLEVE
jgi:subtilisin family serine protease